ncbi:hypothetical protein K458DRAFT_386159 [Lentithecium fluviatile CBS 122367]|uniref:Rhodopsin domain-containing protein n=1 Tax=Lentithecium fluviatile CBS 122367 TaxID=1168545 RepID=A0A6G1JAT6_9PLEO|nr:hypothetical protein K458DRAFT_386159 [Lentithecium fluviatile CBS 122367]
MAVHGKLAIVIAFTLTSLSTVVVALRFYSRYYLVRKLGSPDWVMLIALIATWCSTVTNWYNIYYMDYSQVHDLASFSVVARGALLTMWIFRLNYMINHALIKISILLFYCYIASTHRAFHLIVRFMLGVVILASLTTMCVSIFLCRPVQDAWSVDVFLLGFQGIHADQCLNPIPLWLFNASFNLVTDVFIWFLPIPFFLNLRTMPVKRRLELSAIFSIGIVAVSASAVRLYVTVRWLSSFEENGLQWGNLLIWSQVEQHAGIIAASIPFLRPLVRKAMKARRCRDDQQSPGPVAKLIHGDQFTPENPVPVRTPIIPSPAPTYGSEVGVFRAPPSPLSPISPARPEMLAIHTV